MTDAAFPPTRGLLGCALALSLLVGGSAVAQNFDADRYYQQCLRFEEGGDFETAAQACGNALQIDPGHDQARLTLARVQLETSDVTAAERNLLQLRDRIDSPEPLLLLARAALLQDRLIEAESHLQQARPRLEAAPNRDLSAQVAYVSGLVAERRGRVEEALRHYREAVEADALQARYRIADARLRFQLGDAVGAREQLQGFQSLSGEQRNADVRSLLGRASWALGDLDDAAGHLETALALRGSRGTEEQARDLRTLGLVYLGGGDIQSGTLALRDAARRGNQLAFLGGSALLWLLLLLLVVATHLVAESRIATRSGLEVVEGPQMWSVGQIYGILFASLLVALALAVGYGLLVYDNALALVTPLQANEVRAVLWLVFALMALLLASRQVRRNGWSVGERLLGGADQTLGGLLVGLALMAALLVYLAYRPDGPVLGPWYLSLARLTPTVVAAMLVLPLSELFFRPFAFQALENRYDAGSARLISAALPALVLMTPLLWLFVAGLVLSELYRRYRSGMQVFAAQLMLHAGLVLAVAFSPWVRSLFF